MGMRLFILLWLLLAPGLSSAASRTECLRVWSLLVTEPTESGPQGAGLSAEAKLRIREIYGRPGINDREATRLAVKAYFEDRLAKLPPEVRARFREVRQRYDDKHPTGSHYSAETKEMVLKLPDLFKGSMLEGYLSVHELEHALQDALITELMGPKAYSGMAKQAEYRFLEEAGAMHAEWDFLSAIPAHKRAELVREIKASKELNAIEKEVFARSFTNAGKTLPEYLENEWSNGRYSFEALRADQKAMEAAQNLADVFNLSIRLAAASVVVSPFYCAYLAYHPEKAAESQYFELVCRKIVSAQALEAVDKIKRP